ncbi:MAG: hypothetical protein J7K68_00825 [Candidatus Diapherotrites archaeon]|nr:hypothetical protein [Candidatus Diapherotrites archaeon]
MVKDAFFYYICKNCGKRYLGYCPERCSKCGSTDFGVVLGDWAYSGSSSKGGKPPIIWEIDEG